MNLTTQPTGTVIAVRGPVVDVAFPEGCLPPVNGVLAVEWDRSAPLLLEVHGHLDTSTARAIALQATAGLSRGTPARLVGPAIMVPVGDNVLGRLLDVVGNVRDDGPKLPEQTPRRSIQSRASSIFRRALIDID